MKLVKARKQYTCKQCDRTIEKGEKYGRKTVTIGNPRKQTFERTEYGGVAFVEHGISYKVPICEECAGGSSSTSESKSKRGRTRRKGS